MKIKCCWNYSRLWDIFHMFTDKFQKKPEIPKELKWEPCKVSWLQINPDQLANQLTLLCFALYCRIKHSELMGQSWLKPMKESQSPNVVKCMMFLTQVRALSNTLLIWEVIHVDCCTNCDWTRFVYENQEVAAFNQNGLCMQTIAQFQRCFSNHEWVVSFFCLQNEENLGGKFDIISIH